MIEGDFINVNTGRWQKSGLLANVKDVVATPHNGNGGNLIHATDELSECARLHEEEVILKDSYNLKEFYRTAKDIKYIVDIGANVGAFSYYIKQLYPDAKVIACEPSVDCMHWVKENTHNELVYINKAVVGDPALQEVTFNVCKWAGNHHVAGKFDMNSWKRYGCEVVDRIKVPATTLTKIFWDNKLPQIDLLKIDTEGSEADILEEFKPLLNKVRYIMGEWHSQADLARIKAALKDTHDCTFTDGEFFKEESGEVANGGIYAKLKTI